MERKDLPPIALSVAEAAKLLHVSTGTVYTLAHRQDFPSFKVGNRTLIPYEELKAWAAAQTKLPAWGYIAR